MNVKTKLNKIIGKSREAKVGRKKKPKGELRKTLSARIRPENLKQVKINCGTRRKSQGAYLDFLIEQDARALMDAGLITAGKETPALDLAHS